jgi:hypothetical protein
MGAIWQFFDFLSARGENLIHQWLNSRNGAGGAKAKIQARIFALQGSPVFPDQFFSAYKGWDDIYELKVVFGGIQYRPFGCYGPGRRKFTLLVGGIEKGRVPKSLLAVADDRRRTVLADPSRVAPHDFS